MNCYNELDCRFIGISRYMLYLSKYTSDYTSNSRINKQRNYATLMYMFGISELGEQHVLKPPRV